MVHACVAFVFNCGVWEHLDSLPQNFHLHCELEGAALVDTSRVDLELATIDLHKLLGNHEAQPDAVRVHICRAHQLAELLTEQRYLCRCDAYATVDHLDSDKAKLCVVPSHDIDL